MALWMSDKGEEEIGEAEAHRRRMEHWSEAFDDHIIVGGEVYKGRDGDDRHIWHANYGKHRIGGSRWDRLKLKASIYRYRLRDAWDVLRGRAFVG